jgi:hypothetical protein
MLSHTYQDGYKMGKKDNEATTAITVIKMKISIGKVWKNWYLHTLAVMGMSSGGPTVEAQLPEVLPQKFKPRVTK